MTGWWEVRFWTKFWNEAARKGALPDVEVDGIASYKEKKEWERGRNPRNPKTKDYNEQSFLLREAKLKAGLSCYSLASSRTAPLYKRSKCVPETSFAKHRRELQEEVERVRRAQHERTELPICSVRKELVSHIRRNPISIIVGETGSGKSTQIPQYLLDDRVNGDLIIAATQPRRVAAISLANRVNDERGAEKEVGQLIGYSVRFENCTSEETKVIYVTDGILLREAMHDPLLKRYSIVIIDEAHERTVHTDIMMGIVKLAHEKRSKSTTLAPLKVIVMSATMDVDHFSKYFGGAPVIFVEGRSHEVKVFYMASSSNDTPTNSASSSDYFRDALVSTIQLHNDRPLDEDILVFLTGQEEIEAAIRQVKDLMKKLASTVAEDDDGTVLPKLVPYGLYAAMTVPQQMMAFAPRKEGCRKVIFATNIAETSLTIPGVKIVIDCGHVKTKSYNPKSKIAMLRVTRSSKAQTQQRTGRAGRDAPGRCYRLFSELEYSNMVDFLSPEIQRCSLSSVLLELLRMGIEDVADFPFIDPPPTASLDNALDELLWLGAIERQSASNSSEKQQLPPKFKYSLTPIGLHLAELPIDPKYGRILLAASRLGCLEEACTVISAISYENIFINSSKNQQQCNEAHSKFFAPEGDHFTLLNLMRAFNKVEKQSKNGTDLKRWCCDNFIHDRNMFMVTQIRKQLKDICKRLGMEFRSCGKNIDLLRRALCFGLFMNCAFIVADSNNEYRLATSSMRCRIHPGSCLNGKRPSCVIFGELILTSNCYMREVTFISPKWVHDACPEFAKRYKIQ